jgi:hypothetical protein
MKTKNLDIHGSETVPWIRLEGRAERAVDVGTIERLAAVYRRGGWPAEAEGDALTAPYSAPSTGPCRDPHRVRRRDRGATQGFAVVVR